MSEAPPRRVRVSLGPRGRTLRIDETYASWYAPGSAVTGSVWDALAAPLLLLPPVRRRSLLVLGLGGGSAARVLRALAPRVRILGIERDAGVVRAARRWFDLDELGVEVRREDAQRYLERSRRRFDAVFEDVFVGRGREVHKPDWLPRPGLALAARRVAPGGLLVTNALDDAPAASRTLATLFPHRLRIEIECFENRILVASRAALDARELRRRVAADPVLGGTLRRLRFRTLR